MKLVYRVVFLLFVTVASVTCLDAQQNPLTGSDTQTGRAVLLNLSRPIYPQKARVADISGSVIVVVTVHQDGTTQAMLISGSPMLAEPALQSALQSRFECQMCRTPASYLLAYDFKLAPGVDCCNALAAPVEVSQEPESENQQGQRQTRVTIVGEESCLCDPEVTVTKIKVRSLKCFYLWKCSSQ